MRIKSHTHERGYHVVVLETRYDWLGRLFGGPDTTTYASSLGVLWCEKSTGKSADASVGDFLYDTIFIPLEIEDRKRRFNR